MDNIVYTFDFFDPWDYVTSDDEHGYTYPGSYPCNVAYRGWVPLFCPGGYAGAESEVRELRAAGAYHRQALAVAPSAPTIPSIIRSCRRCQDTQPPDILTATHGVCTA